MVGVGGFKTIWDLRPRAGNGPVQITLPGWEADKYVQQQPERFVAHLPTAGAARVTSTAQPHTGAKPMAGLAFASERVRRKKQLHDAKAQEWNDALDQIDRQEDDLLAAGDAMIRDRQADMDELKANFAGMLSNLGPTKPAPSPKPPPVSPAPAAVTGTNVGPDLTNSTKVEAVIENSTHVDQ